MTPLWRAIFEDQHVLVVSKSAGLLSQGGGLEDASNFGSHLNLVDELRSYFGRHYVGLVHRLDRNTSGLMVVAKRSKAAERLSQSLQAGNLRRSYLALLSWPAELAGDCLTDTAVLDWQDFLVKDEARNVVRISTFGTPGAKEARLKVSPVKFGLFKGARVSLAKFELETGRSHQIRVQAAVRNCPLVGDFKYGAKILPEVLKTFGRPALHSASIKFPHPMSGEEIFFEDPLPSDMQNFLGEIKINKADKTKP